MQNYVVQVVSNLFLIVVIMMIIDTLVPEDYKRYIDIFIGISIILLLISPIFDISKSLRIQYLTELNRFENEFKRNNIFSKETYSKNLVEEYKTRLIHDIKENLESKLERQIEIVSIDIYENINSNDFGKIRLIKIKGDYDKKVVGFLKDEYAVDSKNIIFEEVIDSNDKK